MTNAIKRELYRLASTSKTVNYGDNAHIATSKFEPQVKDADYQAHVVRKFDNVTVEEGKRSAVGGKIYSANTGKEITEDDKYIKTKGIQYNWRTGQYEIRAEVGTAIKDDDNKFEKDPNGNLMLKNSQQAYIPDPNVNNTILHSIYSAYVPNNTQISDKLARDADVINKHIAKYVPYGQKNDIKLGNYYFTKTDQGWIIADVNHRVINQDAKGNIQYVPQQEIPIVIFQDELGKIQNLQDPIEESSPQIPTQNSVLSKYGIGNSNSGSGGSTNQPGKSMEQFNSQLKKGLAKAESGGSYIVFNSKNQPKYGYPTFALGKYQFVPTSHPELMQFVIDNEELVNKNTPNEDSKEYKQFYNKLHNARGTQKLYDEEHIMAYWVFLNSPEIQEAYMDKQLKSYEPYIEEVQKSQNVSRAEAIDLIHLYGVKGAKNKINSPREWSSKINDPQQASLNLLFDEGQESGWKNLNSNAKDNIYKLLNKAGLSNFQFRVSSTNRNNSNAHSTNKTIDFKFPPNQERQVLQAIANLADDPQEALNLLYSQKGTDGNKVPSLKFKSGNQLIKIIYHADSDGHGNHLHIQVI